jgi:hypothetical protein
MKMPGSKMPGAGLAFCLSVFSMAKSRPGPRVSLKDFDVLNISYWNHGYPLRLVSY